MSLQFYNSASAITYLEKMELEAEDSLRLPFITMNPIQYSQE